MEQNFSLGHSENRICTSALYLDKITLDQISCLVVYTGAAVSNIKILGFINQIFWPNTEKYCVLHIIVRTSPMVLVINDRLDWTCRILC